MGSKKRITMLVVMAILLVVASGCLGIACSCPGGGGTNDAIVMMKMLPKGAEAFIFVDLDALRTDDDLNEIHEDMEAAIEWLADLLGIDISHVDQGSAAGGLRLLQGSFDLDEVRDTLEDSGFDNETHRGVEVWETYGAWVALVGDTIVAGAEDDVKDCIGVIDRGDDSMYDDNDFRGVIDKLSDGFALMCEEGTFMGWEYDGLACGGTSGAKKDSNTVAVSGVLKFTSANAAEDAVDEIADDMENDEEDGWQNIRVEQDGEFVEVTAEAAIENMVDDITDDGGDGRDGSIWGQKETARVVFESLRDAPSSLDDPNYQDFQECNLKYLELYTMNIDGSDVQRITDDDYSESQADVSPDGTKILCTIHYEPEGVLEGLEPGWEIAVMDIDGSNLTNLTNNDYVDTGAHWNHDGTKIVYVSDTAHRTADEVVPGDIQMDVYTMNADGSENTRLTSAESGGGYGDPSFSFSEPSKILYNHDEDPLPSHNPDLYMMDADGENKKLILRHEDVDPQTTAINDPMFSPDGSTIIFEAKMGDDEWGHVVYNIFTVDVSGENLKRITQDDGVSEGMPQFSPDGTKLTFDRITRTGDTGGTRHIWVANADRSDEECLSSFHYEGGASWFPVVDDE